MQASTVRTETLKAVRKLSQRGALFQSRDVKELLHYEDGSDEVHYMHSVIQQLKQRGVIEPATSDRARNQYLRVRDDKALFQMTDKAQRRATGSVARLDGATTASTSADIAAVSSAPRRVVYLEDRVESLDSKVTKTDEEVQAMRMEVAGLRDDMQALQTEVRKLVELWS